jgi:hypothetical protein
MLRERFRGDFGLAVSGLSVPFCNLEGSDVDVDILRSGRFGEERGIGVGDGLRLVGVGGVDRPAEPGRPGSGDSASDRCDDMGDDLSIGADAMGLGPFARPERLAIELILALSSSCRLLTCDAGDVDRGV